MLFRGQHTSGYAKNRALPHAKDDERFADKFNAKNPAETEHCYRVSLRPTHSANQIVLALSLLPYGKDIQLDRFTQLQLQNPVDCQLSLGELQRSS